MRAEFFLAAMAGLLLTLPAAAGSNGAPQKVNATLCDTEEQAISLASELSVGRTEPMAINVVNKAAGAEVCGRFVGIAVVRSKRRRTEAARFLCSPDCALPRMTGSPGPRPGSPPSTVPILSVDHSGAPAASVGSNCLSYPAGPSY